MKDVKKILAVVIIAILSGCASTYKIPMTKEFYESKKGIHLGTFMAQKEIDARMPISTAGSAVGVQFGLLGALIGSAIDSSNNNNNLTNKENQIAPLRDSLIDFDINHLYHEEATKTVNTFEWMNIYKITNVSDYERVVFDEDQYFLKLDSSYALTKNFDSLEFFTYATIYKIKKTSKKKDKETVLFRNLYKYVSPVSALVQRSDEESNQARLSIEQWYETEILKLDELKKSKRKAKRRSLTKSKNKKLEEQTGPYTWGERNLAMAKYWSKNDAALIKQHLNEALVEVSKMIKLDLSDLKPIDEYKKDKSIETYKRGLQVVAKSEGRVIVRDIESGMAGQLCSLSIETDYRRCIRNF